MYVTNGPMCTTNGPIYVLPVVSHVLAMVPCVPPLVPCAAIGPMCATNDHMCAANGPMCATMAPVLCLPHLCPPPHASYGFCSTGLRKFFWQSVPLFTSMDHIIVDATYQPLSESLAHQDLSDPSTRRAADGRPEYTSGRLKKVTCGTYRHVTSNLPFRCLDD